MTSQMEGKKWLLCTWCKKYVQKCSHGPIEFTDETWSEPGPPYCGGCGALVPEEGDRCETCRLQLCRFILEANPSEDITDACRSYLLKWKKFERQGERDENGSQDDENEEEESTD